MSKRVVKGWMPMIRLYSNDPHALRPAIGWISEARSEAEARCSMRGERVVRCTITYDDSRPRPARRKGRK